VPEFVAYRLASWDTPLWVNSNRTAHRYNRAGSGPTQYLSLHPLTPWAEYLRAEERRTIEEVLDLRVRLWVLRLVIPEPSDLTFDNAADLGLRPRDLIADDHGPCQAFGDRCRGNPGTPKVWRVPSAALPGTRNLVVFGPRVASAYLTDPIDPEVDVPVAIAAEDGRALLTLLSKVCYVGMPHAEYQAWLRGAPFEFEEPPTSLL
jgi:hypothetical protein